MHFRQFVRLSKHQTFAKISNFAISCRRAAASVRRNISEGGGQQTDRMLIKYLYYSYGSAKEVRTELVEAFAVRYISQSDLLLHDQMYDEIMAMLIGWIRYLRQSDRKDRLIGGRALENPSHPPADSE